MAIIDDRRPLGYRNPPGRIELQSEVLVFLNSFSDEELKMVLFRSSAYQKGYDDTLRNKKIPVISRDGSFIYVGTMEVGDIFHEINKNLFVSRGIYVVPDKLDLPIYSLDKVLAKKGVSLLPEAA